MLKTGSGLPAGSWSIVGVKLAGAAKFNDADLERLAGLPELAILDLAGTAVTGNGLKSLAKVPGLRQLGLRGTSIGAADLAPIQEIPLSDLDLRDTKIDDQSAEALKKLAKTKNLWLRKDQLIAPTLEQVKSALSGCQIHSN